METPFLDQLIEDHENHIDMVEAISCAGIKQTRKQLEELKAIKKELMLGAVVGQSGEFFTFLDWYYKHGASETLLKEYESWLKYKGK